MCWPHLNSFTTLLNMVMATHSLLICYAAPAHADVTASQGSGTAREEECYAIPAERAGALGAPSRPLAAHDLLE
ncbi:exported hypothetical protein [Paraburkholderia tropica]|nr:exported hypothetical protein [Paraburkholderia tropica]